MFSLLLIDFIEYLSAPQRIAGLTLIIIGVASVLLAKKITKVVRKVDEVDKSDKLYVGILTFALVFILAGMIVCCF